ncbi:uncharacterized protein LOC131039530 isoform X2 [Cryptomeria japonica]|uniref:uncharacterized protein LOC131039530 isoform X2 n=1 Tax=Cryptomeria japonica TaxID=3369 RepID=UPI0025ACC6E1|nr:uncharacterized protein LOC131039530 isoform X2 [Cryptomeria japonica]
MENLSAMPRFFYPPTTKSRHSKGGSVSLPSISTNVKGASSQLQTRRLLMLTLLGGLTFSTVDCKPAQAFSFGISGPKEWLKAQKRRTSEFLMAPIVASRDRLNSAYNFLKTGEITSNKDYEEAERLVKVAARDCIPPEEGSFVAFQARSGVEVCTFNLILKNASSLLDDTDPTKLKADIAFKNLVRSFIMLDKLVESGKSGISLNSRLSKTVT